MKFTSERVVARKKLRKQRFFGIILLALTGVVILLAVTSAEKDATAALLTGVIGFYLLFTKKVLP